MLQDWEKRRVWVHGTFCKKNTDRVAMASPAQKSPTWKTFNSISIDSDATKAIVMKRVYDVCFSPHANLEWVLFKPGIEEVFKVAFYFLSFLLFWTLTTAVSLGTCADEKDRIRLLCLQLDLKLVPTGVPSEGGSMTRDDSISPLTWHI